MYRKLIFVLAVCLSIGLFASCAENKDAQGEGTDPTEAETVSIETEPDSPETVPVKTAEELYLELIESYVRQYGLPGVYHDQPFGLTYAELLDFDSDGVDELFLCRGEPDGENDVNYAQEIWAYRGGEIIPVYVDTLDQNVQYPARYIRYTEKDGELYLVRCGIEERESGSMNIWELTNIMQLSDDEFATVKTFRQDIDYPKLLPSDFFIDGSVVDEDTFGAVRSEWLENSTKLDFYSGSYDDNAESRYRSYVFDTAEALGGSAERLTEIYDEAFYLDVESASAKIYEHYESTVFADSSGEYVIFSDEVYRYGYEYIFTVRYQAGAGAWDDSMDIMYMPVANRHVGTVYVNVRTGEVTDTFGGESWEIYS